MSNSHTSPVVQRTGVEPTQRRSEPASGLSKDQKKKLDLRSLHEVKKQLRSASLYSVCEEAKCPNRSECFSRATATFLAMGNVCTRRCSFCSIATGKPDALDPQEPTRLALTVQKMGLKHAVITSVNRDELADGGSAHLAAILKAVRAHNPDTTLEILTPDFKGDLEALHTVLEQKPEVFNHNLETAPSLYKRVRPGAHYEQSMRLLAHAKKHGESLIKTGLMLGLGESDEELAQVFEDAAEAGTDILTLGQYFQPTSKQLPVDTYVSAQRFETLTHMAKSAGIPFVYAGTFVRSSYNADEVFDSIRQQQGIAL